MGQLGKTLYHFTTMDNLHRILQTNGVFPYATHNEQCVEFVSLTEDPYMAGNNPDRRYENYNIRVKAELPIEMLTKVDYSYDFFKNHHEIAMHVFSDMNDDFERLCSMTEIPDDSYNYLSIEKEWVYQDIISLKDIVEISLIDENYRSFRTSLPELLELIESKKVNKKVYYEWEDLCA